jgi:short-subunit dehydrogenase
MKNVALITWASSGIGRELAMIHTWAWGDLVLVARRPDKLEELRKEINDDMDTKIMIIVKDLTLPGAAREIKDELDKFGVKPEYLINNAGFWGLGKFTERAWKDESSMIALNITALTELCHIFLPEMVARGSGRILNVSSTASLFPWPLQAVYYATKAYVTSFSNALSEELHDSHVTVTALMPGATATEFGAVSGMDKTSFFAKTATAESVALDGYKGMLQWKLNIISGLTFSQRLTMKLLPFIPKKSILKMVRKGQEVK